MKKYIGDKKFFKMLLAIAVPIMIQNGVTSFVNLLDNVMVGGIGEEQMAGVAIVNQIMSVFMLCIFGGVSGAGIFTAQYYGSRDDEGVRHTIRFKLYICVSIALIAITVFYIFSGNFISMFLTGDSGSGDSAATLMYAKQYLNIMLIQVLPFALIQLYASTLRECGNTKISMYASLIALFLNLFLNWVLIYGHLGAPALGVTGAAIATVTARFTELFVIVFAVYKNTDRFPFFKGLLRSFRIPGALVKNITLKGMPLLANEFLWSFGMTTLSQCYSTRGLSVVAATNISQTVSGVFNVVFFSLGGCVAIVVGQLLGANKIDEARDTDRKIIFCAVIGSMVMAGVLVACSPFIPMLYNVSEEVRSTAKTLLIITACLMPINAFNHAAYFTVRSGGKTLITVLMDCGFLWVVVLPAALLLSRLTDMNIFYLYAICQSLDIIKSVIAFLLVKSGVWAVNMVSDKSAENTNAAEECLQ